MAEVWVIANRVVAVWGVAFGVLCGYWSVAEAAEPGRQFADPLLPCAWLATFPAAVAAWWFGSRASGG